MARLPAVAWRSATAFSDAGLSAYNRYRYRVRAVNDAGNSAWSNEASGDTGTGPVLLASTDSLEFGKQTIGQTSVPRDVTLTNAGTGPMQISAITINSSISVKPPALRRARSARICSTMVLTFAEVKVRVACLLAELKLRATHRSPVAVLAAVERRALGLGIDVVDVLAAPRP